MATGGVEERSKAHDFRHTCGLCMEPYRGRQPKLLPCHHTFCLPCLTTLAESAAEKSRYRAACAQQYGDKGEGDSGQADSVQTAETAQESGQGKTGGEREGVGGSGDAREEGGVTGGATADSEKKAAPPVSFPCPTCRKPVTVPEGGVKSLQTNFYVDHDEADVASNSVSCDLCEEDRKQDATHACQECPMNLCQSCRKTHDRFPGARAHHVTPLGQGALVCVTSAQVQRKLCQNHPDQPLCLVCQKCDVIICLVCKLTSHEGHVTVDVTVATVQARQDVVNLRAKLNEQIQVLGSLLNRLHANRRQLERQKQEVTREISMRYDVAVTWLTEARDDLMNEMSAREQTAVLALEAEITSVRAALERLQSGQSRAVGVACWGPDVVLVKSQLQDVLLDQATIRQHAEQAAMEVNVTALGCHVTQGGLDRELVRQYMGQLQDGQTDAAGEPGKLMTIREMVAKLTNLETRNAGLQTEMTALKAELSRKSRDITGLKAELSQKLAVVTDKLRQPVFFHVQLGSNIKFGERQTIIFTKILSSFNNSYDVKTGYFTAPVPGTYLFLASVGNEGQSGSVHGRIEAGGIDVARAHGCPESSGSCHAVVKLQSGNRVRVLASTGGGGMLDGWDTWFSGVLLSV